MVFANITIKEGLNQEAFQNIKTGAYIGGLNPHLYIKEKIEEFWMYKDCKNIFEKRISKEEKEDRRKEWHKHAERYDKVGSCEYGIVDTPEQFFNKFGEAYDVATGKFVVFFSEILRKNQPPNGGWRYHKWGEYYGTQDPQHEYIYDDKHIFNVYVFHVILIMEVESND